MNIHIGYEYIIYLFIRGIGKFIYLSTIKMDLPFSQNFLIDKFEVSYK